MNRPSLLLGLLLVPSLLWADGPADNNPVSVRPVPPPGAAIDPADRASLQKEADDLGRELAAAGEQWLKEPGLLALLPDVEVLHKAVRDALAYDEFFDPAKEVPAARSLLELGRNRLDRLREGQAPWLSATGLVVRGYRSRIDGSLQPYGLVVPVSFRPRSATPYRLDLWFHGRGEKLSELSFLAGRLKQPGEFTPPNTIVLHPYGRYCNANKFAGEIDSFEALDHVKASYPVDPDRILVRGFSMGGAACWQFAVHYAGLWAAAAPGAGFSETPDFLKVFQSESLQPTWYEQKLWHLYDCTDYAINLYQCPTVAYSGEIDKQRQAASLMAKAMAQENMELVHIIGPNTAHQYHPAAKVEIERRLSSIAARGRNPAPETIHFTTWTLRYNKMLWLTLDGLEEHWARARVDASILNHHQVELSTTNVSAFTLSMAPGLCPLDTTRRPDILLDGQKLSAAKPASDRSWTARFQKSGTGWAAINDDQPWPGQLCKRPGLQGPIDDAFMDSFLMVRPTGRPMHESVGRWAASELAHATNEWRRQFRGLARVKDDSAVSEEDIHNHHLVLWGDPSSNQILARIAERLPVRWSEAQLRLGNHAFDAAHHAPILIFPNPLNPERYVVVNSGFTFREFDYLNNARQVPKLPDFAIVDLRTPPSPKAPGRIVEAGFFNERWETPVGK